MMLEDGKISHVHESAKLYCENGCITKSDLQIQ
jgi:hypothetical protein